MTNSLELYVLGIPAPQGSKRHVGNGRMIEASKKVKPWREAVHRSVQEVIGGNPNFKPFGGPLRITVTFYLPKPSTIRRMLPTVPPDLDKLDRGLLDALTIAGVWEDDAQVVEIVSAKRYATSSRPSGAVFQIVEMNDTLL
jgi:crossover junction endodeoxyribonuclease RusA